MDIHQPQDLVDIVVHLVSVATHLLLGSQDIVESVGSQVTQDQVGLVVIQESLVTQVIQV